MKRIAVPCILFLCAATICLGQTNQTESVTIATYYPSPGGQYTNLRFSPNNTPPVGAALKPGLIFYNNTADTLQFYNATGVWINLTSASSTSGYWAYNSTTQDINNTNSTHNGTVVIKGVGTDILKIHGDMRIKGQPNDDALFYIARRTLGSNSSCLRFLTNEDSDDTYNVWVAGDPGHFKIGNRSREFILIERVTGKVTIGSNVSGGVEAKLHIKGDQASASPDQTLLRLEGDGEIRLGMRGASSSQGMWIYPQRCRGDFYVSPSSVLLNDSIFFIKGYGYNGTGYNTAASIQVLADRNFDAVNIPSRFSVNTTAVGSTTSVERMVFKANGRIGIGESNPQYALQVRYNSTVEGHVVSNGDWLPASDKRFKKNISGIEGALEKVLRVNGIRYDPLPDQPSIAKKGINFGFIGQELEAVMPELVDTDTRGYKSVYYGGITPVLVEAIKDQQKDIDSLRKEIEALKARK